MLSYIHRNFSKLRLISKNAGMRQLGARLGLGTQPRYEPLRDLRVKHRLNSVINIGCVGQLNSR